MIKQDLVYFGIKLGFFETIFKNVTMYVKKDPLFSKNESTMECSGELKYPLFKNVFNNQNTYLGNEEGGLFNSELITCFHSISCLFTMFLGTIWERNCRWVSAFLSSLSSIVRCRSIPVFTDTHHSPKLGGL